MGAGVSEIFFCWGGGGGGRARVSDFFYRESKSKKFFLGRGEV